ncbi:hypothetical protein AZF37_01075 [endosymbiont 'TC1' of Trimyema compressum]|uniref:NAD-dependent epimerase/dehydratase family protein n=1 Tax=endosymbiont 'TC1' of Trimyema compressum TaxID=243899 RepID=UPI0007F05B5F|nr:NAD-dependent epimerase/dehydratase family protein [endosymbiont 'TC1' of Trimyema compressum]AMP19961.1 hypothetical protein AZF37_01075 [endosymbiont 'TC1' of Trimyema compressum]
MSRVLITGGAGFIGSNLTEYLINHNEEVVIIDNFTTGKKENIEAFRDKITVYEGDIKDEALVEKSLQGVDAVVHLAAIPSVIESVNNPRKVSDNNIMGTVALFDIIAKKSNVKKIVQASSSAIYGDIKEMPIVETAGYNPLSPYAIDKVVQELFANFYSETYGIDIISLRFFNAFGPKQDPKSVYAGVIPIFISKLVNNESPVIFGDGLALRDFIFVGDIAQGIYKSLLSKNKGHRVYNLGTGAGTTINKLTETLMGLMGKKMPLIHKEKRAGEVDKSVSNIDRATTEIGFKSQFTLKEGLVRLLDFMNIK